MATLASLTVALGIDTDGLRAGAERAKSVLGGLSKAVAGLGVGAPAVAAVTAGVGGMAAAFASAGVAASAFKLAVGPQMKDVASAADLAAEAEKAAAEGAEDAAEKQKAYNDALARMPASTRATAKEFVGLKSDYDKWSDSLSSSTMPVFTQGLQVVRRLLPALTPFVKEASKAFGAFVNEIDRSTKGKGLEAFASSMAKVAGQNLKSLLFGLKNIAIGVGGVIKAFLPLSTTMSGGFEESTAAFAKWGQGLSESEGFSQFIDLARQGAQTLGTLAQATVKLAIALAPLIGLAATVATHLADFINSLPPEAVQALAYSILAAVVAFKTFSAASRAVDAAAALMSSRLGTVARRWVATAATSVKANLRIAASSVATAARTAGAWAAAAARTTATWLATIIRVAAVTVARFALMAGRAMAFALRMAASWIIAMGPIGWVIAAIVGLVALIIVYWDEIKAATLAAWDWVVGKLVSAKDAILRAISYLSQIPGWIADWFNLAKNWAIARAVALVNWVKGLPGRLSAALSSLLSVLRQRATSSFQAMKDAAVQKGVALVNWVRGLPGRARDALSGIGSVLVNAGKSLISGFINGIKGMFSSVKGTLGDLTSSLTSWKGPESLDKRILTPAGRLVIGGFMAGIDAQTPMLRRQLQGLTSDLPGMAMDVSPKGVMRAAVRQDQRVVFDVTGADDDMKRLIRRIVKNDGRGDVQTAFGAR
ncbi:hypothetical protein [Streptomyces sp. NPDC000851]